MNKPRVVKDYEKLDESIQEQIKLNFPFGFDKSLITFMNAQGKFVSALPFETEEKYYLVRMSKALAQEIIEQDEDYDDDGHLKEEVKDEYSEKYDDDIDISDVVAEDVNEDE